MIVETARASAGRARAQDVNRRLGALLAGGPVDRRTVLDLEPTVSELFAATGDLALLRRWSRLAERVGEWSAARGAYEAILSREPRDAHAIVGLGRARRAAGETAGALSVLADLDEARAPLPVLIQAAKLRTGLGDRAGGLTTLRSARVRFPDSPAPLAALLWLAKKRKDAGLAAEVARDVLDVGSDDVALALSAFRVLKHLEAESGLKEAVRARVRGLAAARPDPLLWQARLCRLDDELQRARDLVERHLAQSPDHPDGVRELAGLAIELGRWGEDAAVILAGRRAADGDAKLEARCDAADGLLRRFGTTLADAAAAAPAFAHVQSPASAVRLIAEAAPSAGVAPPAGADEDRSGLVMIGGSLAAGGAERIMATAFRRFREMGWPGGVELWLFDVTTPGVDRLFYLPETGLSVEDIVELQWDGPIEEPFSFLPLPMAKRAQAIHRHLVRRRPKVVHAWLDMANLCAAPAALVAGVPRVVLHNHNMRPTSLEVDRTTFGWAECYRALLEREEVTLVNCAEAGIADYLSWMGSDRRERARVVRNGFDFAPFDRPVDGPERARMRAALGILPDAPVVGTALRFEEVKRPFRWLDAAALVHRERPEVRFVLYGDGRLRAAALERAEAIGLGSAVRMPGRVSDLHDRLPVLDLFVLSSSSEGLPNVLVEAQAAGVPVISYDVGGVSETMVPDVTGLLVGEDTAEALAAAVLRAVADRTWRASASAAARAFVRERFSLDAMMDRLVETVGGRGPGPVSS